jgi:uncharacterized membrane protein
MNLEARTLAYLADRREVRVRDLYEALQIWAARITEKEVTDLVWRLADEGKLDLTQVMPTSASLGRYLRMWELNLFLYTSLVFSLAALAAVYVFPSTFPFIILRWIVGLLFVLFVPGYAAVEALFVFAELDLFELIALSFGFSVALTMFVGLLVNIRWGIALTPFVIALTTLTILLDIVALLRRYIFLAENQKLLDWGDESLRKAREAMSRVAKEVEKRISK